MTNPEQDDGLICAFVLDGRGGGRPLGWAEIRTWRPEDGVLWVHLDRTGADAVRWLESDSGIDAVVRGALLAEETRPRVLAVGDALLVILRGVNLNPGAEADDMVAIRMWIEAGRIVSLRHRRLMAVTDIREALAAGKGPTGPGDFLVQVAARLIERMGPVIGDLDDRIDEIEDRVLTAQSAELRGALADLRQTAIALRRYLAPQRDAMARLLGEQTTWLDARCKSMLRETADRATRFVEDLDAGRERAAVTQDELNSRMADQMNRTMYLLTVVAAVLLPPSLLTGLLGINVGGLPGIDNPWAFAIVVVLILVVGAAEILLLRHLKWI